MKSRVFISCGQAANTDECTVANDILSLLEEMGYSPYIAIQEQSHRGLKENVFSQLSSSDYFLFIDFKREQLNKDPQKKQTTHRGSLFSHQELAIASYLNLPVIAFREQGVNKLDGLMQFIQGNCNEFVNRNDLPKLVKKAIDDSTWHPASRNILTLTTNGQPSDLVALGGNQDKITQWWWIDVKNNHKIKYAKFCFGHNRGIRNHSNNKQTMPTDAELKWTASTTHFVTIPPGHSRKLDAFYIFTRDPSTLIIPAMTDNGANLVRVKIKDGITLDFEVHSENFPVAKQSFTVRNPPTQRGTNFIEFTSIDQETK